MIKPLAVLSLLLIVPLAGCGSSRTASPGAMRATPQVLTLGAGDALGRDIYRNDLQLAAAAAGQPVAEAEPVDAPGE
jgi:hypothetical protein